MSNEEREKILKKRSSQPSWRERKRGMPDRVNLIGGGLIVLVFLAIIASSLWSLSPGNGSSSVEKPKNILVPASTHIPTLGIIIYLPEDTEYNTNTPPLNFIAAGSKLKSVLVSVDKGPRIAVSHDGNIANIDFARLNPLFIDDFSGPTKGKWKNNGSWSVKEGKYGTSGGNSSFGEMYWGDYIIEAKINIISGRDVSIDLRRDGGSNYYRVQTFDLYKSLVLFKMDSKGYVLLSSAKLTSVNPAGWHTWKIIANGRRIQAFIDDIQYIDHMDTVEPYLKGNLCLRVSNSNVEYDYVQVYSSLSNGRHILTIFANNTAGDSFSKVAYFTINTT